jgi:hypothetical protein
VFSCAILLYYHEINIIFVHICSIVEKRVFRTSFDQPVDPVVFQGGFTGYSAGSAPPHEHAALALVETLDEFEADIAGG